MKKCRARFGLDQQNQWCKPCRRKKKCIRYMESVGVSSSTKDDRYNDLEDVDGHHTDDEDDDENIHDNFGSCGSGDDNHKIRDDDNESINHSMSSPGGLSSLQSPSTSSASPLSLISSPAMSQHVSGLLNSAVSEQQLQHHQQHMYVLQAQQQHLNQQLLHQTKQHHHHHHSGHMQQSIDLSGSLNTISTSTSAYDGGVTNVTTSVVSTHLPTLSTSSSSSTGSVSGYGSATSCSTNTASTSSPASISDRMVRSLLSSSPALLLGNRIGHLAMGLAMSNNNIHNSSISNDNTYNLLGQSTNTIDGHSLTPSSVATSSTIHRASTTSPNTLRPEDPDKIVNSTNIALSPPICSAASSPDAVAAIPETLCANFTSNINNSSSQLSIPLQRNPIGANPRDINNPLSINQLTKRPREEINSLSSCINTTCATASIIGSIAPSTTGTSAATTTANVIFNHLQAAHHVTQPSLQLSQSHNAIFRNNFSQHFHQQFGHHLVTAAAAVAAKVSASPTNVTQSPRTGNNSIVGNSSENNVTTNALAVNIDVSRRPANDKTTTNESGAIRVT